MKFKVPLAIGLLDHSIANCTTGFISGEAGRGGILPPSQTLISSWHCVKCMLCLAPPIIGCVPVPTCSLGVQIRQVYLFSCILYKLSIFYYCFCIGNLCYIWLRVSISAGSEQPRPPISWIKKEEPTLLHQSADDSFDEPDTSYQTPTATSYHHTPSTGTDVPTSHPLFPCPSSPALTCHTHPRLVGKSHLELRRPSLLKCQARTKSGVKCSRFPTPGSLTCYQHNSSYTQ